MEILLSSEPGYWLFDSVFIPVIIWTLVCSFTLIGLQFLFKDDPEFQTRSRELLLWALPVSIFIHIMINVTLKESVTDFFIVPQPLAVLADQAFLPGLENPTVFTIEWKALVGYFTGIFLLTGLSFLAGYLILFHRLARYHQYLEWIPDSEHTRRIASECGVRIPVSVYRSSGFVTPFTFGIIYPKIVIPTGYFGNPVQFELVLRHELMHISNGDYLKQLIEQTLKFFFIWNPLLHLITRQISNFREMVCDERVVSACPDQKREYANLLLTHLEEPVAHTGVAAAMAHSTRNLKERIIQMKKYPSSVRSRTLHTMVAMGLTTVLVSAVLAASNARTSAIHPADLISGDSTNFIPPELTGGMESLTKLGKTIRYPEMDKKQGIQGKVILNLVISDSGEIKAVQVIQSTGSATLDAQAVVAAQDLKFKPALKDGKPVQSELKLPVNFKLQDDPQTEDKKTVKPGNSDPEIIGGMAEVLKAVIYPSAAKKEGRSGMTLLTILVNEEGAIKQVSVKNSSGHEDLDQAAIKALDGIWFKPAMKDGKSVSAEVILPVKFKLAD